MLLKPLCGPRYRETRPTYAEDLPKEQKSRVERRREKKAKVGFQILHEQLGDILNSVALHAHKIVNS